MKGSPWQFDFTGTEGKWPCSFVARLNNFYYMLHHAHSSFFFVSFQIWFKSTLFYLSFPDQDLWSFSFPQGAAQSRRMQQLHQMEDTAHLLCSKIEDLPLAELGFLKTVSSLVSKYFISSLICKILSRKII